MAAGVVSVGWCLVLVVVIMVFGEGNGGLDVIVVVVLLVHAVRSGGELIRVVQWWW